MLQNKLPVKIEKGRLTHANIKLSPETQFLIYPNPFSDVIRINISEPGKILEMTFTDLSGRKCKAYYKIDRCSRPAGDSYGWSGVGYVYC